MLVLGVVLEVLDYTSDCLVFKIAATEGLKNARTEPLVVPYVLRVDVHVGMHAAC